MLQDRLREMPDANTKQHWLIQTAVDACDPGAEMHLVDRRLPIDDVWAEARRICSCSDEELVELVADRYGLGVANLSHAEPRTIKLVPEKLARSCTVFPLREDDSHLVVATSDPTNLEAEQQLMFVSGRSPVFEVAAPETVRQALEAHYRPDSAAEKLLKSIDTHGKSVHIVGTGEPEDLVEEDVGGEPVIKLANLILREAVEQHASDIHLGPGRGTGSVRYRVDGVLQLQMRLPMPVFNRVVSRIKILGSMDISVRLKPQDGRARIRVHDEYFDLRISTVPTRGAEKCVVRILYSETVLGLSDIGLSESELVRFRQMLSHRDSIVFVTGPTGSGKTTTLYAALRELATGDVNIMTVEDPVEYELEGLTQIQVEPKRGVTFASALRAILRQDPDIILIGEIRDPETAEIAVQAAQTGHLVLSTLHTNDALGVIPRLVDLGLTRQSIADSVGGMVAQRLVRKLRPDRSEEVGDDLAPAEIDLMQRYGVSPKFRAVEQGDGSSPYKGRLPVLESVVITPPLRSLISSGAPPEELRAEVRVSGTRPLRDGGRDLVAEGVTTLEELDRALGESATETDDSGQQEAVPAAAADAIALDVAADLAADAMAAVAERMPGESLPPSDALDGSLEDDGDEAGPAHVIMADDDAVVRKVAQALLEKAGFKFTPAVDGVEAMELLNSNEDFDLMILDLDMPKLMGADLLRIARSSPRTAGLPIVVLTGSPDMPSEVDLIDQGADDYIRKPLEPARFLARVKAVLRRAGG